MFGVKKWQLTGLDTGCGWPCSALVTVKARGGEPNPTSKTAARLSLLPAITYRCVSFHAAVAVLILLLSAFPVYAQTGVSTAGPVDLTSATCNGTTGTGCVALDVTGDAKVAVQITGSWTGTITFDCSVDGLNFQTITVTPTNTTSGVQTASANGIWQGTLSGVRIFRVRFSAFTSGIATVTIATSIS